MIYWIHNYCGYMHCKQYDDKLQFMIGRQSGDYRPISVCLSAYGSLITLSSTDRLAIVGRLTPDDRATFVRYHEWKNLQNVGRLFGRSSGDDCPTLHRWQNPWKSVDRSTKGWTWVLRQKSRRPTKKSFQNRCRRLPTIGLHRPITHFWLTDRQTTVGLGNVTVV